MASPCSTNQMTSAVDHVTGWRETTENSDDILGDNDVIGHTLELEGVLERRDDDGKWHRVQCALKQPSLLLYSSERDDNSTQEVTDLAGYEVTELIDQFQGKRFVLMLEHQTKLPVLLSLDSREDLAVWKHGIISNVQVGTQNTRVTSLTRGSQQEPGYGAPPSEESRLLSNPSSAQSIKQKLLAEMLRQKLELERMQAARAEIKAAHTPQNDSLVLDEERIIALTRLRQRRMSTQIKLQTIQRQMESAQTQSPREKKSPFLPLGRKRAPDLLQQTHHAGDGGDSSEQKDSRTALEAQVKSLSSRLHDLDENIAAASPREETNNSLVCLRKPSPRSNLEFLRHSLDPSCLPTGQDTHLRDSVFTEDDDDVESGESRSFRRQDSHDSGELSSEATVAKTSSGAKRRDDPDRSGKDAVVSASKSSSGGFKSSVQKLAHRTFSRATGWSWATKKASSMTSTSPTVSSLRAAKDGFHNNNNTTITSLNVEEAGFYDPFVAMLSDSTPDVIDMTTKGNEKLSRTSRSVDHTDRISRDDSDTRPVPGSSIHPDQARLNTDSITLSKTSHQQQAIAQSAHRTPKERILSKIVSSSSMSGISRFENRLQNFSSSSPNLAADDSRHHYSRPVTDFHDTDVQRETTRQVKNKSWRPSSLAFSISSTSCHNVASSGTSTLSASSPRRSEVTAVTPRREVNPDALAQIEAFEELSMRYLEASQK